MNVYVRQYTNKIYNVIYRATILTYIVYWCRYLITSAIALAEFKRGETHLGA